MAPGRSAWIEAKGLLGMRQAAEKRLVILEAAARGEFETAKVFQDGSTFYFETGSSHGPVSAPRRLAGDHAHDSTEAGVRFRLWAPAARVVEVKLEHESDPRFLPMDAEGEGWFALATPAARPGTRYRFRIDAGMEVPDPASRYQPDDVNGPSVVVDPDAYAWQHPDWRGRPWHETVLYELHVGTFTPAGTFEGLRERLGHLVELGVTAIELMPIADFSGGRNWGYDGVLPFAPDSAYGTPEDLKRLVDEAHGHGLMVFLDVVYNHFGPEGNYLHVYAPQFFDPELETPWGAAIDFSRREVRDFFIENALYWLEEYRFDGLRFDAVHAIVDDSQPDILEELADRVLAHFGPERKIHLVLENDDNVARYLGRDDAGEPTRYVAQWNDDIHHVLHVLATGERAGYYRNYAERPIDHLGRCLSEGFAYQGELFERGTRRPRGEASAHLPATAFVGFIQNHDQVGNRAFGERLWVLAEPRALKTLTAILLLAPGPPLLFMGEEWGAKEPFLYFCDFRGALADSVREGRRREFAQFPEFKDDRARERIPDPMRPDTFERSRLDWSRLELRDHRDCLESYRALLHLRRREIVPRLAGLRANLSEARRFGAGGLLVTWQLGDGTRLSLLANLAPQPGRDLPTGVTGRLLHATEDAAGRGLDVGELPPWSAAWYLD